MVTQYNPQSNTGKAITRGKFPAQARMLAVTLDFSQDTIFQVSIPVLHGINNNTGIDGAQSVLIDNSDNGIEFDIVFDNGFRLTAPAYSAGWYPVLVDIQTLNFKATCLGGALAYLYFTNTREQPAIWSTHIPIAGNVNVTGSTIFNSAAPGIYTDHSVALTGGGTDQTISAASGARLGFIIKNPATPTGQGIAAPEPIYINFGSAAGVGALGSIELLPGETLTSENVGICSTQAIHATCVTAGHQIILKTM